MILLFFVLSYMLTDCPYNKHEGTIVSADQIDGGHCNIHQNIADFQILPAKLKLRFKDLPWLISSSAVSQESRLAFWLQIVNRVKSIRSILINSLHGEGGDSDLYDPPQGQEILPVGPLLFDDGSKKTTAMWQTDQTCTDWLDKQSVGSVIYVSFGSWAAPIGPEKNKRTRTWFGGLRTPILVGSQEPPIMESRPS